MAPTLRPPRPRRVVIESPYAGNIEYNLAYLKIAMYDSICRGEAPFASHLIYPLVLNDDDPEERRLGIGLGTAWLQVADLVAFYIDLGMSPGMKARYREFVDHMHRTPFELRRVSSDALNTIRESRPNTVHTI